jgi:glycosyltransferase involved in cell wall biosynthesis
MGGNAHLGEKRRRSFEGLPGGCKRVKIALVAPTEIPARRANTIQVMKMAQALVETGHDVRVTSPSAPPSTLSQDRESRAWSNMASLYGIRSQFPVEWLPIRPWMRRYDYGLKAVRWAHRWGTELLYTRLPQCAALASLMGISTIYEIHDFPAGLMAGWLLRGFLAGKGAVRLVVISQALAQDLAAHFNISRRASFYLVAPDGVDLARYENLPSPREARQKLPVGIGRRLGEFVAGYSGHLYAGRGVEVILGMAACLPQVSFLLSGGEPEDVKRVQAQAADMGLNNVILTGFIPNADLPLYQASCDVLLMPYQAQVAASSGGDIARYLSPMKLFEYLACGRAILSSDLPVLRETLTPEIAILLPPADVSTWVTAVQGLLSDPVRCQVLGDAARQVAGQYSWENRARRILDGL